MRGAADSGWPEKVRYRQSQVKVSDELSFGWVIEGVYVTVSEGVDNAQAGPMTRAAKALNIALQLRRPPEVIDTAADFTASGVWSLQV